MFIKSIFIFFFFHAFSHHQINSETSQFQRKFVNEVRNCDELERKLRFIENEITKIDKVISYDDAGIPRAPLPRECIDLEVSILYTSVIIN